MQNKKNTWFDRIKDVLGESPKAKEDLLELSHLFEIIEYFEWP